jgi:hypothetical protein
MTFGANTAPRNAKRQGGGSIVAFRMVLSTTIYKGDIVRIDKTTGLCTSLLATASMAQYDMFAGVAAETKTAHATLVTYINVYTTGVFEFATVDTAAVGDIGEVIYSDCAGGGTPKNCIISSAGHDLAIGTCVDFPTTSTRLVRIDGYAANGTHGVAAA